MTRRLWESRYSVSRLYSGSIPSYPRDDPRWREGSVAHHLRSVHRFHGYALLGAWNEVGTSTSYRARARTYRTHSTLGENPEGPLGERPIYFGLDTAWRQCYPQFIMSQTPGTRKPTQLCRPRGLRQLRLLSTRHREGFPSATVAQE